MSDPSAPSLKAPSSLPPPPMPTPTPGSQIIQVNPKMPESHDLIQSLGAGGYSALNSALLGIPDAAIKAANSDAYSKLKAFREANKGASATGDVLGTVGSLFIPGGAITKGIGLGTKALTAGKLGEGLVKAGEFLGSGVKAGDSLGALAAKGAGQTLEQAVPRNASQVVTGDETLPQALGTTAAETAAGGGIGALLGKGAQFLSSKSTLGGAVPEGVGETGAEFLQGEAKEKANQAFLSSIGLQTRAVKKAAGQLGLTGSNAGKFGEDYVADVADVAREYNIRGKQGWEALADKNKQDWGAIDSGFQANAPTNWGASFTQGLLKDPEVAQALKTAASADQKNIITDQLQTAVGNILANGNDLATIRQQLSNSIKNGLANGASTEDRLRGQVSALVKGKLDDTIGQISGQDVDRARRDYKALQPYLMQEGKDVFSLAAPLGEQGSPTAEKLMAAQLTGSLLGSSVAGAGQLGYDAATGQPLDLSKAGTAAVIGALAGPKVIGLARNAANKTASGTISNLLSSSGAQKAVEAVQKGAPVAADNVPRAIPGLTDAVGEASDTGELPAESPAQGAPAGQNISTAGPALQTALASRLKQIYATGGFSQYDDFPTFVQEVAARTNNFDPRFVGKILYSDEEQQKRYARDVQIGQQLKNLPLGQLFAREANPLGGIAGLFNPAQGASLELEKGQLGALLNGGKPMDEKGQKILNASLAQIGRLPENQRANAFVRLLKASYGVDLNELSRVGAI